MGSIRAPCGNMGPTWTRSFAITATSLINALPSSLRVTIVSGSLPKTSFHFKTYLDCRRSRTGSVTERPMLWAVLCKFKKSNTLYVSMSSCNAVVWPAYLKVLSNDFGVVPRREGDKSNRLQGNKTSAWLIYIRISIAHSFYTRSINVEQWPNEASLRPC